MSEESQKSEVLGERTSAILQNAENRINEAQKDKWKAITTYLEGAGIDRQVTNVNFDSAPDGRVIVEFAEPEEDDSE